MAARLIDGKALAQQVRERLATESAELLAKTGIKPGLATILVGDDPASHLYVKNKQKACEQAGILHRRSQAFREYDAGRATGIDRQNECRPYDPRNSGSTAAAETDR